MTCLGEDFHDLPWSQWHRPRKIYKGPKVQPGVPREPGVYRIRIGDLLAYLGESSNLARRLVDDWGDLNTARGQPAKSRKDPFRRLVNLASEMQGHYEVSWASGPGQWPYDLSEKAHRECLERCLGWIYRRKTGRSPLANYARPGEGPGRCRRPGEGGQLVSGTTSRGHPTEILPSGAVHVGTRALVFEGRDPRSKLWMGLSWTKPECQEKISSWKAPGLPGLEEAGKGPGLYKILGAEKGRLLFVGWSHHVAIRLREVMENLGQVEDQLRGAWCPLPRKVLKLECLELLGDLIGAHYCETGTVAPYQFAGVVKS